MLMSVPTTTQFKYFRTHESEPKPFLYPFLPRLDSEWFDMPAKEGFDSLCLHEVFYVDKAVKTQFIFKEHH